MVMYMLEADLIHALSINVIIIFDNYSFLHLARFFCFEE